MLEKNKKQKEKKWGWGYIIGSLVLGAGAMAVMPAIINGLSDTVSQKIKYPVPENKGPVVVKKDEEGTKNGDR